MTKQNFEQLMFQNYKNEIASIQQNYEQKNALLDEIEVLIKKAKSQNIELPIINQILSADKDNEIQRNYVKIMIQKAYEQLNWNLLTRRAFGASVNY